MHGPVSMSKYTCVTSMHCHDCACQVVERQLDVLSTCGALVCAAKARSLRCVNVHNALAKQLGRDFVVSSTGQRTRSNHESRVVSLQTSNLLTYD